MLKFLLLAILAVALWLALQPEPTLPPKEYRWPEAAPAPRPRPPKKARRGRMQPTTKRPPRIEHDSPFRRRLYAGRALRRAAPSERRATLARVEGDLLFLDHAPAEWPEDGRAFTQAYFRLVDPRRDRDAFECTPFEKALVRVWTKGRPYPGLEAMHANRVAEALLTAADAKSTESFDVLATNDLAKSLFPEADYFDWAAGVYHPQDRLCTVRLDQIAPRRRRTLLHEIVHAVCHRVWPEYPGPLVSEGVARYLSSAEDSTTLSISRERLADDMARLQRLLERLDAQHVPLARATPGALLGMDHAHFYAARKIMYPLAHGIVAHAGFDAVVAALREGSPRPLETAIARMRWSGFREFVARAAKGGVAARAVADDEGAVERMPLLTARDAFARIGITVPPGADLEFDLPATELFRHPDQQAAVAALVAHDKGALLVVDRAAAMDLPYDKRWTRRELVAYTLRNSSHRSAFFALDGGVTAIPAAAAAEVREHGLLDDPAPLARWLGGRPGANVLLMFGSGAPLDGEALARRTAVWERAFRAENVRPGAIYVDDLVPDGGEAHAIAKALFALTEGGGNVAYSK